MMLAIDIYLSHTSGLEFHLILDEVRVNFGLNSCSEGHARCNPNRETHLATSHTLTNFSVIGTSPFVISFMNARSGLYSMT
jgi:hypothetical protein